MVPGVGGDVLLLEVRPVPVRRAGALHERAEPLRGVRIGADVEPVGVQRAAEDLDLRAGGRLLGLADVPEQPGSDQAHQQAQDDDDDEQLHQGEAGLAAQPPPHSGISLIEKIASSIATTMNATMTPMLRMMIGSSIPTTRFISVRTSVSKVSAVFNNISSSRPVSSPTRTMCTASAGNAVCSFMPAAMVPPRLPTTAMAPSTGTPLLSIVPSVRAKRAVSTLSVSPPIRGSRSSV